MAASIGDFLPQYSTVNKPFEITVQYSKEESDEIFKNLADVIPNPDYYPYYRRKLLTLGKDRFMEFVAKSRAGSDTPHVLFKWMLNNPKLVK